MSRTYRDYGSFSRLKDDEIVDGRGHIRKADGLNLDVCNRKNACGWSHEGCRGRNGKKKFKIARTSSDRRKNKEIDE